MAYSVDSYQVQTERQRNEDIANSARYKPRNDDNLTTISEAWLGESHTYIKRFEVRDLAYHRQTNSGADRAD